MDAKTLKTLEKTLKFHARGLGLPPGSANDIIALTLKSVQTSLSKKRVITDSDVTRAVVKELKTYHADLGYVYQKYDTII